MNCTHLQEWNIERVKGYDVFQVNFKFTESIANIGFKWSIKNRLGAIVKEFKQGADILVADKVLSIKPYKESLPAGDYSHVLEYTNGGLTRPLLIGDYKVTQI